MILNDYDKIINENFDLNDNATRRFIVALEDSEQTQLMAALSSALYDKIVKKVDVIDFGSIPRSRGDITKVDGFNDTVECLTIMKNLVKEYRQDPTIVDNVLSAIENLKNRKGMFMKAYALNVELPMMLYNLTVAAIEESVSFLISVCIQYIKDPETKEIAIALDKVAYNNTKQNMLYEQIVGFNSACASGELDNAVQTIIKGGKMVGEAMEAMGEFDTVAAQPKDISLYGANYPIHEKDPEGDVEGNPYIVTPGDDIPGSPEEPVNASARLNEFFGAVGTGLAVGAVGTLFVMKGYKFLITVLIPFMRNIAYCFINLKVSIKDMLNLQAQFIEMNAYKLQNSSRYEMEPEKMKKVVQKQLKVSDSMKKLASKIVIDYNKAEKKAEQDISKEAKSFKVDDIKDEIPADIYDKSVLF